MARQRTEWIAVDWGSTHLRAWVFGPDHAQLAQVSSRDGMSRLASDQFEAALIALIGTHLPGGRATPVICCGTVGARQGWAEAAYARAPCVPPGVERATRAPAVDPRLDVRILPGVCQEAPADAMRGEETQIAGFLSQAPGFDGVICLPGTHTKWVRVSAGEIVSFRTFMTGELFAAISQHTVLRHSVGDGFDEAAFLDGVQDGMTSPQILSSRLFGIRAEGLVHGLDVAAATSRLSGLLVGLELVGARGYWLGQRVALIGGSPLSTLYGAALTAQGVAAEVAEGDDMVLAGLRAAWARFNVEEGLN